MKSFILTAAFAVLATGTAFANDYRLGDLVVSNPVVRATPVNAPVSAGYMTIANNGADEDRLVAASSEFSAIAELHAIAMDGDVMKMRQVDGGILIPAGESVTLMLGGFHVMFMQMEQQLQAGETHMALLTFEKAGTIEVMLNVQDLATIRDAMGDRMKSDHSNHKH